MDVLVFPSDEALQVALKSGLVPSEVQRAPAAIGRSSQGEVLIAPSRAVAAKAKKGLFAAGVHERAVPSLRNSVSCWAEALAPNRIGEPEENPPLVLFSVTGQGSLLDLAGELLRLGCDRMELRALGGSQGLVALVKVIEAPWFVLSRALDHLDGLRAFVPTPAGQDRVWTEVGYEHPLVGVFNLEDDQLLCITGEGAWWRLPIGPFFDVDTLVEVDSLPPVNERPADVSLPKILVTLTLARASKSEAPTLFVLRPSTHPRLPTAQVEALVRGLPEAQLDNILFAVTGDVVVLRARPGRDAHTGALPGTPYARVAELQNLFVPVGLTVEPPLRRDRLRTWLAPDPDLVTWLEPTDAGFSRLSLSEDSFRPLTDWVEYVIDGAADTLEAWVRSATFDLEPFIATQEATPSQLAQAMPEPKQVDDSQKRRARPRALKEARGNGPGTAPATDNSGGSSTMRVEGARSPSELEALVTQEENGFLEMEVMADSPARQHAWARLAELYARVQWPRDAGMAWAYAVWEAGIDGAGAVAQRWADTSGGKLESLLAEKTPNVEQTRAAVSHLFAQAAGGATVGRLADWTAFFDRFENDLDVRSFWLARVALSRLSGGDALGLARARDRVLARLQRGLSLDRDVPRLMRVTGVAGAGGAGTERALRVASQLEGLLKAFDETPRKRSPVEAPPHLTRAYVGLEFAWGFARLGSAERARAVREQSLSVLEKVSSSTDPKEQNAPVHRYLMRAYSARIDQALEGVSPETPLGPAINGLLPTLEPFQRYKVDRLRQFSHVLEPQERLDATTDFFRAHQNQGAEELAALRGMKDAAELLKGIEERARVAADTQLPVEERARLIDGLLDFLPSVPESQALPLLQHFVSLSDAMPARLRALLYEDALKVAGHFGRSQLVKQLVASLGRLFGDLGAEGISELGATLVAGVRSLRRVGLREEAGELLQRASAVLKGEDTRTLIARLGLAGGLAYLGQSSQAMPIIEDAQGRLARGESGLVPVDRLRLTRFTARALGHLPTETALPGLLRLAQQLPWVTDAFNTNSHFCLSLVDFADALVLGHVGDDLTLNEATRRFLEEDEYLVRRRVHRDVGSVT
jgi:cellulose synthase operon protein C